MQQEIKIFVNLEGVISNFDWAFQRISGYQYGDYIRRQHKSLIANKKYPAQQAWMLSHEMAWTLIEYNDRFFEKIPEVLDGINYGNILKNMIQ